MKKLLKPEYGEHDVELFDALSEVRPDEAAYAEALQDRLAAAESRAAEQADAESADTVDDAGEHLESRASWTRCFRAAAAILPPVLLPATVARAAGVATATAVKSTPGGLTISFLLGLPGLVLLGVVIVALFTMRFTRMVSAHRLENLTTRPKQLRRVRRSAMSQSELWISLPLLGVLGIDSLPMWGLVAPAFLILPVHFWRRSVAGLADREITARDAGLVLGLLGVTSAAWLGAGLGLWLPLACLVGVLLTRVLGSWHLGWVEAVRSTYTPLAWAAFIVLIAIRKGPGSLFLALVVWVAIRVLFGVLDLVLRGAPRAVAAVVGVATLVAVSVGLLQWGEASVVRTRDAYVRERLASVPVPSDLGQYLSVLSVARYAEAVDPERFEAELHDLRSRASDSNVPDALWQMLSLNWIDPAQCAWRLPSPTESRGVLHGASVRPTFLTSYPSSLAELCDPLLPESEKDQIAAGLLVGLSDAEFKGSPAEFEGVRRVALALRLLGRENRVPEMRPDVHRLLSQSFAPVEKPWQRHVRFHGLSKEVEFTAIWLMSKFDTPDSIDLSRIAAAGRTWSITGKHASMKSAYFDALLGDEAENATPLEITRWVTWLPVALVGLLILFSAIAIRRSPVVGGGVGEV